VAKKAGQIFPCRVGIIWSFHLGLLCFLCCSCLSVSTVPQYSNLVRRLQCHSRNLNLWISHIRLFGLTHRTPDSIKIMHYSWSRQRVMFEVLSEFRPVHLSFLATPVEPFVYQPGNRQPRTLSSTASCRTLWQWITERHSCS
jgi:hypothetical protein